jgi:hypothetical protein
MDTPIQCATPRFSISRARAAASGARKKARAALAREKA